MPHRQNSCRRGIVAVNVAFLLVPLMGMLAFCIDAGYVMKIRTDLQRAADAAAMAGVRELVPDSQGNQNVAAVRATVRSYADSNIDDVDGFQVLDSDIEIGRYDRSTVYSTVTLLATTPYDTVRVKLRRDAQANSPVSLFFARVLGFDDADITATSTAILRQASQMPPNTPVLPFAVAVDVWDSYGVGGSWKIYNKGKIKDADGNSIPGNWGTVDIGNENNSTHDLSDQIEQGLRQTDLDALYANGRIPTNTQIDATESLLLQGDPGLSSGIRDAVESIEGKTRYVPIFDDITGGGNNAEYHIVGWGAVKVVDSNWQGSKKTWIQLEKVNAYDSDLTPHTDLSDTSETIDGAYSSAALVE